MLASPSLGKRPVQVLKGETIKAFSPFRWAREKISIKIRSIESRFVIGPSNIPFADMCTFQPGNFTGCGSEGVKHFIYH